MCTGKQKPGNARAYRWTGENRKKFSVNSLRHAVDTAKQGRGRSAMLDYLDGKPISRTEALHAKCAECMAWHADGRLDCLNPVCPLYPWMPYRTKGEG